MTKYITLICIMATLGASAQPLEPVFEKSFAPSFFDYFMSNAQKDFYLSQEFGCMMINSDLRYTLISTKDGNVIGTGDHLSKVNALSASVMGILRNRSFNREDAIEKVRFDEGTEYLVFEEAGIVIFLDWNANVNRIKAVDLGTGNVIWSTDKYRFSSSSKSQYVDAILGMSLNMRLNRTTPRDIAAKSVQVQGFGEGVQVANEASAVGRGFMVPMSGTGHFLLRLADGSYVALELGTGAEKWTFNGVSSIGFSGMSQDGSLILVNYVPSYLQKNERLILKLDPLTGKELWRAEHISNFRQGRTYLIGDRLVCDYYGAEVFDLKTGERIMLTLDERVIKTQNRMAALYASDADGSRGTAAIASSSVVEGKVLYASVFKQGKRSFANDGSGKAIVQAFDLTSGQLLWESEKMKAGTDLSFVSPDFVFVRRGKAFGSSSLFVLDAHTGKLLTETESIDGFIYRASAGDVLTGSSLFRGGKKNVYTFSTENWLQQEAYRTDKLSVGKLTAMVPASDHLMTIGTKGLVFFDGKQAQGQALETPKIYGSYWNDQTAYLFLQKRTIAIDLESRQEVASISVVPERPHDEFDPGGEFLFSRDGSLLAVIRGGQYLTLYRNK